MRSKTKGATKGHKNRKHKLNLVFDEAKRREFLTGFHKRKLQRKKDAKEALELELKQERKRLKSEAKESFKKLVVSHRPIPELETLLNEEYDDEDVTVKVVELSTNDIAKKNNWIGTNQPKCESDNEENPPEKGEDSEVDEISGMALKAKPVSVKKKPEKRTFESEKQLKKTLKKQATQKVQQSKIFQRKNRIERVKQMKKSRKAKYQEQGKEKSRKGHSTRRKK